MKNVKTICLVCLLAFSLFGLLGAKTLINLAEQVTGVLAVANGGTGVTSAQGNGSKVQLGSGSTTANDCTKYDGSGNIVDAGVSCGTTGVAGNSFFGMWNFVPPPTSSWTADNCGVCTITSTSTEQYLHSTAVGTTAQQFHGYYRTAPSTPYVITATMFHDTSGVSAANSSSNNASYGIGFRDGTGKLAVFQFITFSSGCEVTVSKWTNSTTPNSNPFSGSATISNCDPVLKQPTVMQIKDDGTTIYFQASIDGVNFYTVYSEARGTFFTSTPGPTQVIYGWYAVSVAAQSVDIGLVSWYVH
jgi:hypothetical protein